MIALVGPGVLAPGPLRSARQRIEEEERGWRENSWPDALEALALIGERRARRRELFLDAESDGDAVGFAAQAGAVASQHALHQIAAETALVGPMRNDRSRGDETLPGSVNALQKIIRKRDSQGRHVQCHLL